MKKLLATALVSIGVLAGTAGANAAGTTAAPTTGLAGTKAPAPSPAGKAYGFHAFFGQDVTMRTHRGWLVVCLNGHAHPWLKSHGHASNGQGKATFTCPTT